MIAGGVMRGDPRGVSGRLNNTSEMWAMQQQHQTQQPQQPQHPPNKMGPSVPPTGELFFFFLFLPLKINF